MRSYRKGQAHIHAAAVALDRRIEEPIHLGKGDYLVEFCFDLGPRHTEDRAVEEDILTSGQFGMEPRAYFKETCDPAAQNRTPSIRLGNTTQDFQQGRFACAVSSDNAKNLPSPNLKIHVL